MGSQNFIPQPPPPPSPPSCRPYTYTHTHAGHPFYVNKSKEKTWEESLRWRDPPSMPDIMAMAPIPRPEMPQWYTHTYTLQLCYTHKHTTPMVHTHTHYPDSTHTHTLPDLMAITAIPRPEMPQWYTHTHTTPMVYTHTPHTHSQTQTHTIPHTQKTLYPNSKPKTANPDIMTWSLYPVL